MAGRSRGGSPVPPGTAKAPTKLSASVGFFQQRARESIHVGGHFARLPKVRGLKGRFCGPRGHFGYYTGCRIAQNRRSRVSEGYGRAEPDCAAIARARRVGGRLRRL